MDAPSAMSRFFGPILMWTIGLVGLCVVAGLVSGGPGSDTLTLWGGIHLLLQWVGLFFPFATFAGGIAFPRATPSKTVGLWSVAAAVIYFIIGAYAEPVADYRREIETAGDVAGKFPMGPLTPKAIVSLRASNQEDPPAQYSHSVNRPLSWPPNRLTYFLHLTLVVPSFCVLFSFLGQLVGFVTTGLSPPARANVRWALGLLAAASFLVPASLADAWVRQNPSNSGILGAWGPLIVPWLALVGLMWLARRFRGRNAGT